MTTDRATVLAVATSIGIRDLRNRTTEAVELARTEGEVIITSHGRPVAVLHPYVASWKTEALRLLHEDEAPNDSGLTEFLAADDEASLSDLA